MYFVIDELHTIIILIYRVYITTQLQPPANPWIQP